MKQQSRKIIYYFILPLIVVYSASVLLIYFFYDLNWDKSGVLGDTIGGITSPLVNLLAAYLVYISFEEQRASNTNQEKQMQISREDSLVTHYLEIYSQIKSDLNSETAERKIKSLLIEFEILITTIKTTLRENHPSKEFLLNLIKAKITEVEKFTSKMNEDEKTHFQYLKSIVSNG